MSEQRLTNLSYLEEVGMNDEDLLIEMVEMFLKNTPDSIEQLRQHHKEDNWKKLSAEAHKLKPNLSYVGLEQAREIVINIEKTAKTEPNPDELLQQIDEVDEICQIAYEELKERLRELKN
ncbi:Hpt domain-containing protein [Aliifodinibius sp. S!AR15-10]|uniref:Hpt domain-containing protein n=1 Tax=Aliifodinibius sp. S!AR15-10 TaxID=2950437 RepID=UPI00285BDF27|nr:Hpt domain-containing protein [Aliifodinibius sp. S!AR15-10]MDR8391902.1 Hpt domain-containing protein [Aliifodinibius sp. S!AR15-10]